MKYNNKIIEKYKSIIVKKIIKIKNKKVERERFKNENKVFEKIEN